MKKQEENQPQLGEATFKAAARRKTKNALTTATRGQVTKTRKRDPRSFPRDRQSLPREKQKATKRFISGTLQNHHRKQVAGTFEKEIGAGGYEKINLTTGILDMIPRGTPCDHKAGHPAVDSDSEAGSVGAILLPVQEPQRPERAPPGQMTNF